MNNDVVIYGVPLAAAVMYAVNYLKGLGLDAKWAAPAAWALATAIVITWRLGQGETFSVTMVIEGVMIGLAASGMYSGGKAVLGQAGPLPQGAVGS